MPTGRPAGPGVLILWMLVQEVYKNGVYVSLAFALGEAPDYRAGVSGVHPLGASRVLAGEATMSWGG